MTTQWPAMTSLPVTGEHLDQTALPGTSDGGPLFATPRTDSRLGSDQRHGASQLLLTRSGNVPSEIEKGTHRGSEPVQR